MNEAMEAEFDTVAEWTAGVVTDLGFEYALAAGCRGSGSPPALNWLIDAMGLRRGDVLVDSGAGIGGPAAYAARTRAVRPLLVEPEPGACRAARALFGLPVLRASGSAIPLPDASTDAAWSLGVLCTMDDQPGLLRELARVVRPGGAIGLLVYVATRTLTEDERPEGNSFPSGEDLGTLVDGAGLRIVDQRSAVELGEGSTEWQRRTDRVRDELAWRYGDHPAWLTAERQSRTMGELIASCAVVGTLLHIRRR